MASLTEMKPGKTVARTGREALAEIERLKKELARYRSAFDSARLVIGHEFNRPLTSINGYIDLLESRFEAVSGEKESLYFAKIKIAVGELEELVESFIQMLSIDSGLQDRERLEEVDLGAFIEKISRKHCENPGVIEKRIDPEVGRLFINRKYMEVIMDNLISNALKHGGEGKPVTVTALLSDDMGAEGAARRLVITVRDGGEGIPENEIGDIFNPFYKGSSNRSITGLGLGLALVKNVVSMMKGEVGIESRPGEGTAVSFSVPLAEELKSVK